MEKKQSRLAKSSRNRLYNGNINTIAAVPSLERAKQTKSISLLLDISMRSLACYKQVLQQEIELMRLWFWADCLDIAKDIR